MVFRNKSNGPAAPAPVIVPVNADGEPDMRGLGRLLWQKKSKILGFTLICAAAAFVVVNAITPRYRSESRVLLEARQNVFLRADADKNVDRTTIDPETVASQVQVLLSRDLASEVIKKAESRQQTGVRSRASPAARPCARCSACSAWAATSTR